jgi:Zn-dependent metalloprotease
MEQFRTAIAIACCFLFLGADLRAAAQITSVDPRTGVAADSLGRGGTMLTVSGSALADGMSVRLSGGGNEKALLGLTLDARAQTFTGRIPFVPAGRYDVKLYIKSLLASTLADAVDVVEQIDLVSVSPTNLRRSGGDAVTVKGARFTRSTEVRFGAHPLVSPRVSADGTAIQGLAPALDAGEADGAYDVTAVDGPRSDRLAGAVTYLADPVQLLTIIPCVIPEAGGVPVTFVGKNFRAGVGLEIGGHALTGVEFVDAEHLTGIVPALSPGLYDAAVVVVGGTRVVLATLPGAVESRATIPDPVAAGLAKLRGSSSRPIRFRFVHGFPRAVYGGFPAQGANAYEKASSFLRTHAALYGLGGKQVKLLSRRVDAAGDEGLEIVRMREEWGGIPVHGAELVIALHGDEVVFTVGKVLGESALFERTPAIGAEEAVAAARVATGLTEGKLIGETRLVVFDPALRQGLRLPAPRLAYRVCLAGPTLKRAFIDAATGDPLFVGGMVQENGGSLHGFDYELWDAEEESTGYGDCHWFSSDTHIASESDFNLDYNNDIDAVAAHFHIKQTYAFYHDKFNRHSWDGDFAQFEVFIHSPLSNTIASWWPWPCTLIDVQTGGPDREILTHEYTHGVIEATSGLGSDMEAGALNEHYADVMGLIQDRMLDISAGLTPDWTVGEGNTGGMGAVRDFQNPSRDHYDQIEFGENVGYPDNGRVHLNANIGNKAVFLMVEGGTNHLYAAPGGLSLEKLMRHQYLALRSVPSDADYEDACYAEKFIARYFVSQGLYNFNDDNACAIEQAWAAVGLGLDDMPCGPLLSDWDSDGVPNIHDNCIYDPNPTQSDIDYDGIGDACDDDMDGDGFKNWEDICPTRNSPYRYAECDDWDADLIPDVSDNCPEIPNFSQQDTDGDFVGDVCEPDHDGDGVEDDHDNCIRVANPGQENGDGDCFGDACDGCPTTFEICAITIYQTPLQPDSDEDGIPDACDNGLRLDGVIGYSPAFGGDGKNHHLSVEGQKSTIHTLPFEICPHGDCPEYYEPPFRIQLLVDWGDPQVKFWVTSDEGKVVADSRATARADLRFRPLGGAHYFLNIDFGPKFTADHVEFDAQVAQLPAPKPPTTFQRGDSNGDGTVDLSDAVTTLGYLFVGNAEVHCLDAADSNDDDELNITDGIYTLSYLFTGGAPIPDPGKDNCGLDPGVSIGCEKSPGCPE